jgi:putative nucleotidyltransferase with HDIG domain
MKISAMKNMELCYLMRKLMMRDQITFIHSFRVSKFLGSFAEYLQLELKKMKQLQLGALLHDIGKIYIEEELLNKKEKFTDQEYQIIQQHPVFSEQILQEFILEKEILAMARHHHERWDGGGYPDQLQNKEISFEARLLTLADSLEAMTGIRPYRNPLSWQEGMQEIQRGIGTQFDPYLSKHFINWMKGKQFQQDTNIEKIYRDILVMVS